VTPTYTARQTCVYSSTLFIPPPTLPLCGKRAICCRIFTPAQPVYPVSSLRVFSPALTGSRRGIRPRSYPRHAWDRTNRVRCLRTCARLECSARDHEPSSSAAPRKPGQSYGPAVHRETSSPPPSKVGTTRRATSLNLAGTRSIQVPGGSLIWSRPKFTLYFVALEAHYRASARASLYDACDMNYPGTPKIFSPPPRTWRGK